MEEKNENLLKKRSFDQVNSEQKAPAQKSEYKHKWVLISDNRGRQAMVNLKKEKKMKWQGKFWVNVKGVSDSPLPNYFRLDRGVMVESTQEIVADLNKEYLLYDQNKNDERFMQEKIEGTNATIYASDVLTTQKLTIEDIQDLKNQGLTGEEISHKVLEGNQNFHKRTEFSKQKILDRKKQKYDLYFYIERPAVYNCLEYTLTQNPKDLTFIREDTFSLFMQYADINPDSHVYVCERAQGAILASALQILDDSLNGQVYQSDFKAPGFNIKHYMFIQYLDLSDKSHKITKYLSFDEALNLPTEKPSMIEDDVELSHILIANDQNEVEVVQSCENKLVSGGKIVIYNKSLHQMEQISTYQFDTKNYINIQVVDTFMRKMQILPQRTHPEMQGTTFGGYILTAYKVDNATPLNL